MCIYFVPHYTVTLKFSTLSPPHKDISKLTWDRRNASPRNEFLVAIYYNFLHLLYHFVLSFTRSESNQLVLNWQVYLGGWTGKIATAKGKFWVKIFIFRVAFFQFLMNLLVPLEGFQSTGFVKIVENRYKIMIPFLTQNSFLRLVFL